MYAGGKDGSRASDTEASRKTSKGGRKKKVLKPGDWGGERLAALRPRSRGRGGVSLEGE